MKKTISMFLAAVLVAGSVLCAASYDIAASEEDGYPAASEETVSDLTEETDLSDPFFPEEEDATDDLSDDAGIPEEEPAAEEAVADTAPVVTEEEAEPALPDDQEMLFLEEDEEFAVIEEPANAGAEDPGNGSETEEKYPLASVKLAKSTMVYTGKGLTQSRKSVVTAIVDGEEKVLVRNQDYTVKYKNNTEVGKATAVFTGIGAYTGTIKKNFKIVPAAPVLKSLSAGTKSLTVKWNKQTDQVTGFAVHVSRTEDFAKRIKVYLNDNTVTSTKVTGLSSGKNYYVRMRAYKLVDGVKYYSGWTETQELKLTYNSLKISGSGVTRTVYLLNPKSSVTSAKIAVWSKNGGEDGKKWYTMKKTSAGSFKVTIQLAYLKHSGTCFVQAFTGDTKLSESSFKVPQEDYIATRNTVIVNGSGLTRKVRLIHPYGIKNLHVAVWSDKNQKDLRWYTMKKQSDGNWLATVSTLPLINAGTCDVHLWANDDATFVGKTTFKNKIEDMGIKWNTSWEFAGYSKVHTGTAKLYRATKKRKGIVVGINSGHGTILPAGQDNKVWSHPDHTPKVTSGSTAAGEVKTICDNTGMTFNDGTPEANVTLEQGLILKDVLLKAGYDVIVIRENNDSGLDVIARTVICNQYADCHISLHWDGDVGFGYDKGIFYMSVPDALKSMYPTSTIWSESNRLGDSVIQGMRSKGLPIFEGGSMQMDLMQTSYSKVPSIDIELGNQSSSHTTTDLKARANAMLAGLNIFFGQN